MMPATFTVDVLRDIIADRLAGIPAERIAAKHGWGLPRLARINRDHRIGLFVPEDPRDGVAQPAPSTCRSLSAPEIARVDRRAIPSEDDTKATNLYRDYKTTISVRHRLKFHAKPGLPKLFILGRIVAWVLADEARIADALASRPGKRFEPLAVCETAAVTHADYKKLNALAKREKVFVSHIITAFAEYVIRHNAWDRVLDGEGK